MSLPNKRSAKILRILLKQDEAMIIKNLADRFAVSARTIRSDLKKIDKWLEGKEFELVKKPRVGVWLESNNSQRSALEKILAQEEKKQDPYSPAVRKKYILKKLLETKQKYTMKDLGEELYVSRTTIYNDLKSVAKWLGKYNLELVKKRNSGIEVSGSEKNWRKAVTDLLADLKGTEALQEMLAAESPVKNESRIDTQTYQELKSLFGAVNFRRIEDILEEAETELEFLFTDEAFVGLVIHIAISIERLEKNKDIEMSPEQLANLKSKEEFAVAEFIAQKLEKKLNIAIPVAEIGYISLHILGAKLQQNIQEQNVRDVIENTDSRVVETAQEIISLASDILEVKLADDEQLLVGLVLHLRPAINRLKYGMSLRNPLLDRIKDNYPSIFGAAWATSKVFENNFDVKVNEEEIGYIALHLGAALERINQKTKAIIVCSSGIGTSQLIASKLAKKLSGIEIIDLMSAHKLSADDLQKTDVVISTIPLEELSKPVIQVSSLVTDNDINLIKEKTTSIVKKQEGTASELVVKENQLEELLATDLIFIGLQLQDKEEIIRFLSEQLLQKKYITEEFINSALEREKVTSTGVGNQVAIPHGQEKYVKESKVAIAILDNKVDWGSETIKVVFLLALKDKQSRMFFKSFHQLIDAQDIIQKLKEATTKEEIKNYCLKGVN